MKAILLAAGRGTRFEPLSKTTPKLLTPVMNHPLLDHFLNILKEHVNEIIIVVSEPGMAHKIEKYVNDKNYKTKISFVYQEKQLGTGHALQTAKNKIKKGEIFFVLNGDDIYSKEDIDSIAKEKFALLAKKVKDPSKFSALRIDSSRNMLDIVEKPKEYVSNLTSVGVYKLNTDIFDLFRQTEISPRGEYEITDGLKLFALKNNLKVIETIHEWIPIGYPWHILEAHENLLSKMKEKVNGLIKKDVYIKGKVCLGKKSIIKEGAYLDGNILIGENTIIDNNVKIKGNVVIGDNCYIGYSSLIEDSVIMNDCHLENFVNCKNSVLGKNVYISSMVCTVDKYLDQPKSIKIKVKDKLEDSNRDRLGAIIGDKVKIGTGVIIKPGEKIYPQKIIF